MYKPGTGRTFPPLQLFLQPLQRCSPSSDPSSAPSPAAAPRTSIRQVKGDTQRCSNRAAVLTGKPTSAWSGLPGSLPSIATGVSVKLCGGEHSPPFLEAAPAAAAPPKAPTVPRSLPGRWQRLTKACCDSAGGQPRCVALCSFPCATRRLCWASWVLVKPQT